MNYTLDELLHIMSDCYYGSCDDVPDSYCNQFHDCHDCKVATADAIKRCATGYVRLPVGADGEKIYVTDVLTVDGIDRPVTVISMHLFQDGWRIKLRGINHTVVPSNCRQYRLPAVEDVLREFALACEDAGNAGPEVERIAADFAKRLRLREGGDAE